MSAATLQRAAAEIREEWPESREMGMDRQEWRFHRAVAAGCQRAAEDWDDDIAAQFGERNMRLYPWLVVARAYLGERTDD